MGLCWSINNVDLEDDDVWESLSPPIIPFAQEFIEQQQVKKKVEEANRKMDLWDKPIRRVHYKDGPTFDYTLPPVTYYGPPSPIVTKTFAPSEIECDCGRNCVH